MRRGYSLFRRGGTGSWYVAADDGTGNRQVKKASADKAIANEIGRALAADADRVRRGVVAPAEVRARRAGTEKIKTHVDEWQKAMKQRGTVPDHYRTQRGRVLKLATLGQMRRLNDLTAARAQAALARISEDASPQSAQHYHGALNAFVKWCRDTGRILHEPLLGLKRPKAAGQVYARTAIPAEKLPELIRVTKARRTKARHSAEDRAMFYAVLGYTGLRRSEAESLTPESFDFSDGGSVTVLAAYSKNRREDTQPVPADVAAMLKAWLADKKPGRKVFSFGKHWNCEELFRQDCLAAGIAPVAGERLGVHSLRRTYITCMIRSGGLAVAQDMARHSTPAMTKRYSDLDMKDYRKALAGLPAVEQATDAQKRKQA